jgi:type IV pilus assembly protein PilN
MRARLNLATKPLATQRRFLAGAGLIAAVAGMVFLALGLHVYKVRQAASEFRKREDQIRKQTVALEDQRDSLKKYFDLPENAKVHDRAVFINGIIDARSFNWTQMFMDLEKVLPAGVHVLSIEPKQAKGRVVVKLRVGAASEEAKLKFLRSFESSKEFTRIEVVKDGVPPNAQGGDVSVLELSALYSRT